MLEDPGSTTGKNTIIFLVVFISSYRQVLEQYINVFFILEHNAV
jgi:hypothetical protein